MNLAISVRGYLKLTEEESALLLDVPEETVWHLQVASEPGTGLEHALFTLLAKHPAKLTRMLLEERISSVRVNAPEYPKLVELAETPGRTDDLGLQPPQSGGCISIDFRLCSGIFTPVAIYAYSRRFSYIGKH